MSRLAVALAAAVLLTLVPFVPALAQDTPSLSECQAQIQTDDFKQEKSAALDLAIDVCTQFLQTAQEEEAPQAHYARALALFRKHDFYHAVKDLDRVISRYQVPDAYILRGLSYEQLMTDDPAFAESAIDDLDKANAADKYKEPLAEAHVIRGTTALKKGDDAQGREDQRAALELLPDRATLIDANFAQAYAERGEQHLGAGRYDQAVSDLQQALKLDATASRITPYLEEARSGQPGPYAAMARAHEDQRARDYERVLADSSEALKMKPDLADARLDRGSGYMALDRLDEALNDFDEAIRLDGSRWDGFYSRGQLYKYMGRFEAAAADFDKAAALIETAHDPGYENEKSAIDGARKSLAFNRTLEGRWVSYLKGIQAAHADQNWSGAPYDLRAKPPASAQPAPGSFPGVSQQQLLLVLAGLVGLGLVVFLLARVRRG